MSVEIIIPDVGQPSGEVTILKWLKRVGEQVREGEVLLEVETDKAVLPIEATATGVLREIRHREGEVVPVLAVVALMDGPDGGAGETARPAADDLAGRYLATMRSSRPGRVLASPLARRIAARERVNLAALSGSGPHGRVLKGDVLAFLARKPAEVPAGGELIPLSATRSTIAERMAASWSAAPQVTLTAEADAVRLVRLRDSLNADAGEALQFPISYNDLFVKIVASALRQHPRLNARLEGDGIRLVGEVNVGVAVDTERGLLVPVVRNADGKGIGQIARELRELVEKAHGGRLAPEEMTGSTFTITNLGMYGIDAFTPIINLPECAVLGIGRIAAKPVEYKGKLRLRERVVLSLTFDHRLVDGAPAARFLQHVGQLVEKPHLLML
jgi:pyruvate dehydrogenase E2 component (dihydrolipoamide acetyltransferase)